MFDHQLKSQQHQTMTNSSQTTKKTQKNHILHSNSNWLGKTMDQTRLSSSFSLKKFPELVRTREEQNSMKMHKQIAIGKV